MENRRGENHRAWAWYQCPGFNTRMSELHISLERKVNMAVQYEFTETVNNHYQIITIVLVFFLACCCSPPSCSLPCAAWRTCTGQLCTCSFSYCAILEFDAAAILYGKTALSTLANCDLTWVLKHLGLYNTLHSADLPFELWLVLHCVTPTSFSPVMDSACK